ncbi:MAG: GNAT family N-acetyltransferase [Lewinellaceae bacterium]|nr:GNAT family N-acetyltransferase [Saprospiraceae bacterium]MCB9340272.1 GNAT family N-acetyltransferase [Lewinellaceae bacterium]
MPEISIAQPEDIPALVEIINLSYRGEPSKKGWTTEADLLSGDIRTDVANVMEFMSKENAVYLKCTDKAGHISGCVYLEQTERGLYLGMFSVHPEMQGRGIGKLLLTAAEERARQLDCPAIFMQVVSERPELQAWYCRYGYELTGERRPFDGDPKFGVPKRPLEFLIMEKKITQ